MAWLTLPAAGQNTNTVVSSVTDTNAAYNFEVALTFPKTIFTNGEPVICLAGLTNISDVPTIVGPSYTLTNLKFFVTNADGVQLASVYEPHGGWVSAPELVPAHGVEHNFLPFRLSEFFKFTPGGYRVSVVRWMGYYPTNDITFTSQVVTIRVLESPGASATLSTMLGLTMNAHGGQATNQVSVTTNIVFYLTSVKGGEAESRFKSNQSIEYLLHGTSTHFVYFRRFPSGNFDFHLFDESGREVGKSKAGLAFTDRSRNPTRQELGEEGRKFEGVIVDKELAVYDVLFRPDDMFDIASKGTYELEVKARICIIVREGLPDYKAMLDGRNVTPAGYPFVGDFGVVESAPLRVQVIKD